MKPDLTVEIAGLKLRNPTMLAAGVLGISGSLLKRVAEAGAGAVVTKSIGPEPRAGYPNPTVADVRCGLLNAMGLPNPGIKAFSRDIIALKTLEIPLIVSVFGSNPQEFVEVAREAEKAGADALELNASCPHVKGISEICQHPRLLSEIVKSVKSAVTVPTVVKLSPNVADIAETAKIAEDAGADAVTAINTVRAMAIEIETGRPILANKTGGLSGPAIKPITVRCVYEISKSVKIPVIGCGGIACWQDAIELLLAGATAVQIGTAIAQKELKIFKSVASGIQNYLKNKGYKEVQEIVGLSHQY